MKTLKRWTPALALIVASAAFARDEAPVHERTCFAQDVGSLILKYISPAVVLISTTDSSGAEDSSGTFKCDGPQYGAYLCTGQMAGVSGSEPYAAQTMISEAIFAGKAGGVPFDGVTYFCGAEDR
jgi:hypothetical protein